MIGTSKRPVSRFARSGNRRRGPLGIAPAALMLGLGLTATQKPAGAFAAEDLIDGPFHHEVVTEKAASQGPVKFRGNFDADTSGAGQNTDALNTLGWTADYIDSYLYSPLWWAQSVPQTGLHRFKISMSTAEHLERLHFDDLFSSDKVHHEWQRYTSGTMAGLLWAAGEHRKNPNDPSPIHAAQIVVGVSLHAMQDFYSHSNWMDDPARRTSTYFDIPLNERPALKVYTGAYEKPEQLGIKHHGKPLPNCAILKQPAVHKLMELACSGASPFSNNALCLALEECGEAEMIQHKVAGIKVPKNMLFAKPGIALDNSWLAEVAVKERGLDDISGQDAFLGALELGRRQSMQWLATLEEQMERAGAGDFWERVKTTPATPAQRNAQFENYSIFPYQFLTAGEYGGAAREGEQVFLRVRLKTADEDNAGTNSDIVLDADSRTDEHAHGNDKKPFLLDYASKGQATNPAITYDDFEKGDDTVYAIGPFSKVPDAISIKNDTPKSGEVFTNIANDFKSSMEDAAAGFTDLFLGSGADFVQKNKKIWMPNELTALGANAAGQNFTLDMERGDEGHYRVHGTIRQTRASAEEGPQGWREFQVSLKELECVRESKWDRGSNSDEPFVLAVLSPLPGEDQPFKTNPFDDVDKGERNAINHNFAPVRVPKEVGMLNVTTAVYESDDESDFRRQELLNKFAGTYKEKVKTTKNSFVQALAAATASAWKLEHIEVTAWSRNGQIKVGTVLDQRVNRWLEGQDTLKFNLNEGGMRAYNVSTDDLLRGPSVPLPK